MGATVIALNLRAAIFHLFLINYCSSNIIINYNPQPRYSVLRLQTDNEGQFDAVRRLFNRSTELKVNFDFKSLIFVSIYRNFLFF